MDYNHGRLALINKKPHICSQASADAILGTQINADFVRR